MWRLRPSFMLQHHKSNAENCWTAARCQSRKKRERGGVSLLKASGLYWPVFQRSDAWISHRNYLSRTILFIAVWVLIALLHPEQAESLGWCFFLPQWDKNTFVSTVQNNKWIRVGLWKYVWNAERDQTQATKRKACGKVCLGHSYRKSWTQLSCFVKDVLTFVSSSPNIQTCSPHPGARVTHLRWQHMYSEFSVLTLQRQKTSTLHSIQRK